MEGGVASPLLADIALNVLDWHLHERGCRFVRYADDFVVLCRGEGQAKEVPALIPYPLMPAGVAIAGGNRWQRHVPASGLLMPRSTSRTAIYGITNNTNTVILKYAMP